MADPFGTLAPGNGLFGLTSPADQERNQLAELLRIYGRQNAMPGVLASQQRDPAKIGPPTVQPGSFNWWVDQALGFTPLGGARDMAQTLHDAEALPPSPSFGQLAPVIGSGILAAAGMVPGGKAVGKAAKALPEIKAVTPDQWGFFKAVVPGAASEFKDSMDLSRRLAQSLMKSLDMKPQGASKWSHYGHSRASGTSLRVSDHEAHNLGSMGVGTGREMSVVVSPNSGELILSSPAIRERYGMDTIRVEMPEADFGKLTSEEGRAWLLDLLQHGGVR